VEGGSLRLVARAGMREYHVRICEGLGVKFPGSTRQLQTLQPWRACAEPRLAGIWRCPHCNPGAKMRLHSTASRFGRRIKRRT
jgi:hypothetical protein